MAKTIYITGDRSMNPVLSVMAADQLIKLAVAANGTDGLSIVTGNAPTGVENALRFILKDVPVLTVYDRDMTEEGRPNYDKFNQSLLTLVDEVYVLHSDPLNSSIAKSVMTTFPEDKVRLVLQDDMSEMIPKKDDSTDNG